MAKKFPTILGVIVLAVGVFFGIYFVNSKKVDQNTDFKPENVRITNVSDNKFTVSWTTKAATTGEVMYGKVGEKLDKKASDTRDSLGSTLGTYTTHYITISDLQPNTAYAFRIASENGKAVYDSSGAPYSLVTGPTISSTPSAEAIYGQVQQSSTLPAEGAIVYVSIPGAAPASTLVKSSGAYTIPVSVLRSIDLKSYISYDPEATVVTISVEHGSQKATAEVAMNNAAPVPLITMGSTHDYRTPQAPIAKTEEPPVVAELNEASSSASPSATVAPIFNVEPLAAAVTSATVTITNPSQDGEVIATAKPELAGKGPKATVLSLVLTSSQKTYKETLAVDSMGTWAYAPTTSLADGNYTLSISYVNDSGKEASVKRSFVINTKLTTQPAFVSTPSASIKPSIKPSPSVRAMNPATTSGIPVTGLIENTVLTVFLGAVIMIGGALLLTL